MERTARESEETNQQHSSCNTVVTQHHSPRFPEAEDGMHDVSSELPRVRGRRIGQEKSYCSASPAKPPQPSTVLQPTTSAPSSDPASPRQGRRRRWEGGSLGRQLRGAEADLTQLTTLLATGQQVLPRRTACPQHMCTSPPSPPCFHSRGQLVKSTSLSFTGCPDMLPRPLQSGRPVLNLS